MASGSETHRFLLAVMPVSSVLHILVASLATVSTHNTLAQYINRELWRFDKDMSAPLLRTLGGELTGD
jgi:hypothetical protein